MSEFTWVEIPTWAFHSGETQLTRSDVTLAIHLCSKADETGFISADDIAFIFGELGYPTEDIGPVLTKLTQAKFIFPGPRSEGQYINFFDNRQCVALFNKPMTKDEDDDSIKRVFFPLEVSLDNRSTLAI